MKPTSPRAIAPPSPALASTSPPTLAAGQFYGAVDARWRTELVTLSVVEHPAPRQVPLHSHAHLYVSLLLRGGYREWVGDQVLEYQPLTAVFHPEQLEHRDEITQAGSSFFIVEVDPALLGERERRRRELATVRDLSGGPMIWALLRLLDAARGVRRDALEGEEPVAELLDEVMGSPAAPGAAPRWLGRVEERLRDDYRAPVSLRALADTAGVHPTHVARVFRRHHGCTMRAHLHRLRVLHASRLMAGASPLAAVAVESGFCDQAHLTHVFRAITGMTPTTYRRLLRGRTAPARAGR